MGLLGTAAKAYVATRVVGATQRRQQNRWAEQDQAIQPGASPAEPVTVESGAASILDQLTQLGQLRDAGVLSEAEFETTKQRILASA